MRESAGLLGIALACALAPGCDDLAPCDAQGDTQPCECAGGAPGAQVCLPELIWAACDCTSEPAPDGGTTHAGGTGGGGSGASSGTGGAGGAGGARPPAGGSGDEDAGAEPDPGSAGAGAGGAGAGSGGSAGTGGQSGEGGASAPMSAAYRDCMNANSCDEDAECLMSTPGLLGPLRVCSPACSDAGDCPVPEGTYDADVVCTEGRCRIDCTEMEDFPLPTPQSCPEGMACIADEFPSVTSYCYDDGL